MLTGTDITADAEADRAPGGNAGAGAAVGAGLPVAAERVAELAHREAAVTESRRRLSDGLLTAVTEAGFARHFVPRRWGGTAGTFTSLLTAAATVGEACASTAWCATLYAAHGRIAAYLPDRGQEEVWGDGPNVRIAASIVPPQGAAVPAPGEPGGTWSVSGRWSVASGVDGADWILLASRTPGSDGEEHRIFVVPRSEVTVVDTWDTLGLRGTGSNTVEAAGVVVPPHRTFTLDRLLRPAPGGPARCHSIPYPMVAALMFAAPVAGAARGAHRAWARAMAGRRGVDGRPAHEGDRTKQVLARSSAEIEAAWLVLARAADRADGAAVTPRTVAENQRDAAMAVTWCAEAADRLFRSTGLRGQAPEDPVQRHWRDITAAAGHAALRLDTAADAYARSVFAEPVEPAAVEVTRPVKRMSRISS